MTIFSIVQQGVLEIIGTHRKFKQVPHYKRTCVREAKVIYNIKKSNGLCNTSFTERKLN